MKILISNCGLKDGANYSRTYCLAKELVKLGNDVSLLTAQNSKNVWPYKIESIDGLNIISFPDVLPKILRKSGIGLIDPIFRFIFIIKKDFDLVFADSGFRPTAGFPCWLYKLFRNKPYVCEWWDLNGRGGQFDLRPLIGRFTIGIIDSLMEIIDKKIADGIVCVSHFLQQKCVEMNIPIEKTMVLHGGADVNRIPFIEQSVARTRLGLNNNYLLGIAGINNAELKNLIPFLAALKKLQLIFTDIAWFSTGEKLPNQKKAEHCIGKEHIQLAWLSYEQYALYLSAADILICPLEDTTRNASRWPNKLGDYLAAGRPIVTNAVGEIKYFSELYPDTIVITEWEEQRIYETLLRLLSDSDKAKEIGTKARIIAENKYSWCMKSVELEAFMQKIIKENCVPQ
jgi:glycosyltransferase involved in cell wall biosynthesis